MIPHDEAATVLVPVKLTPRQLEELKAMDTPISEWVRAAVEDRLVRESPGSARRFYREPRT